MIKLLPLVGSTLKPILQSQQSKNYTQKTMVCFAISLHNLISVNSNHNINTENIQKTLIPLGSLDIARPEGVVTMQ